MTKRQTKISRRIRRARTRVCQQNRLSLSRLAALFGLALLFPPGISARAQDGVQPSLAAQFATPRLADNGLAPGLDANLPGLGVLSAASSSSAVAGLPCRELLRGRGSRAGYVLSHGNIAADTLSVDVGGRSLRLNRDFWLDAANGTLFFASSVSPADSISVYYRYTEGNDAARQAMSVPGLQLRLGSATNLGLLYGMTPGGGGAGTDISTYGLALSSAFGASRRSQWSGLAYFSNPQHSDNTVLPTLALAGPQKTAGAKSDPKTPTIGLDHLLTQNLGVQSGKFGANIHFSDVGKDFSGFGAMRLNAGSDKAALDAISQLEGEKGVKRLGFGLGFGSANGATGTPNSSFGATTGSGGLALNWDRIQDGKGSIAQTSLGFQSSAFHALYATRSIDSSFALFKGLREADKSAWEHEKGLHSTRLGLGFAFGAPGKGGPANTTPNGLEWSQTAFGDAGSGLSTQSLRLQSGGLGLRWLGSKTDRAFKRVADLSDSDRNALALDIARQYDPGAKAEAITEGDRAALSRGVGLARDAVGGDLTFGKAGGISFSQLRVADSPETSKAGADKPTPNNQGKNGDATDPGLTRQAVSLHAGALSFDYNSRSADTAFSRIGDLTDLERNALALDTRRALDPNVKPDAITQKDREAAAKEAGLARTSLHGRLALGKNGKTGVFSLAQIGISTQIAGKQDGTKKEALAPETSASIRRAEYAFVNKSIQFTLLNQSISDDFNRLSDRGEAENAAFGNEHGLTRRQESLFWQMNAVTKIGFNRLSITPTGDAILNAIARAQKEGKDAKSTGDPTAVQRATQAALNGVSRESLSLETRGLTLKTSSGETGKDFTRAADLALPEADRSRIASERGFNVHDLNLNFSAIRNLKLDARQYDAQNDQDKIGHMTFDRNLQWSPVKGTSLFYIGTSDLTRSDDKLNGSSRTSLEWKQNFGKTAALDLTQDSTTALAKSIESSTTTTDRVKLEGGPNHAQSLQYEAKRLTTADNKFENTTNLDVSVKPASSFSFSYSRLQFDKGENKPEEDPAEAPATSVKSGDATAPAAPETAASPAKAETSAAGTTSASKTDDKGDKEKSDREARAARPDVSQKTDTFNFEWQATRQFAVVGGFSQKGTNNDADASTVSVGLKGDVAPNVTLTAKFDEAHDNGKNTHDVADIALSNGKPLTLGPIRDISVTARYASLNDQRKLQNETMTGRAAFKIWKNEFLLDYGGFTKENGESTISRLYSFKTDPNPGKWFHGSFLYKQRTLVTGEEQIIRRFTADWKLTRTTNFVYTYGTLPEDEHGSVTPLTSGDIAFKHAFRDSFSGQLFYRISDHADTKVLTRSLGLGVDGRFDAKTKYSLAYSMDVNGLADRYDHTNHLHLLFDRQINGGNFLTLSAEVRTHDAAKLEDDIVANIDYRLKF